VRHLREDEPALVVIPSQQERIVIRQVVNVILSIDTPDNDATDLLPGQQKQQRLFRCLENIGTRVITKTKQVTVAFGIVFGVETDILPFQTTRLAK
jgi:hypothetical protein